MCLIAFAWQKDLERPLVLMANRDEFYARPTRPMHVWEAGWIAGRDEKAGGTWLGVSPSGRWAALTNVREPGGETDSLRSRGEIIPAYLDSDESPVTFLKRLHGMSAEYNGFNVLAGDPDHLAYYSNRTHGVELLSPGYYAISNARLDTPWPKVRAARRAIRAAVEGPEPVTHEGLRRAIQQRDRYDDHLLPETGVGPEWERALSSMFIETENYGTRSTTSLLIRADGALEVSEYTSADQQTSLFSVAGGEDTWKSLEPSTSAA